MSNARGRPVGIMFRDGQRGRTSDYEDFGDPPADTVHNRQTAILLALVRSLAQEAARDAFKAATIDRGKNRQV